jgi:hypothetical protein
LLPFLSLRGATLDFFAFALLLSCFMSLRATTLDLGLLRSRFVDSFLYVSSRGSFGLIRPRFGFFLMSLRGETLGLFVLFLLISSIVVIWTTSGKPLLYNRKKEGNEARCYVVLFAPFQQTDTNELKSSLTTR